MSFGSVFFLAAILLVGYLFFRSRKAAQYAFIENYTFSAAIGSKVKAKYPHLTDDQVHLVMRGLREYFLLCQQARKRLVSMPSQVVDVAWHEFILFTRQYQRFCQKALGRFLHHTPSTAMKSRTLAQEGIKRAWRLSCIRNHINPKNPSALPLLFAIDTMLNIEDGFKYSLNCKDSANPMNGDSYCAGHIGCSSGCSGDSSSGCSGDSSGCSGGGCGGGD